MSNSNTTDLVSYSEKDDYSNFWKDLKPIKYESPIEILRKHVNNFKTIITNIVTYYTYL